MPLTGKENIWPDRASKVSLLKDGNFCSISKHTFSYSPSRGQVHVIYFQCQQSPNLREFGLANWDVESPGKAQWKKWTERCWSDSSKSSQEKEFWWKRKMLPLVLAKAASKPSRRLISWILSLSIIGSKIAKKENAIEWLSLVVLWKPYYRYL